jgi:sporulation protein YlmC with PRC-barrel domain
MRRESIAITLVAGGLALATMNLKAQPAEPPMPPGTSPGPSHPYQYSKEHEAFRAAAMKADLPATSIIGMPVRSESGQPLGTVEDLVINLRTHGAPFAIVATDVNGKAGAKRVAVPMRDLHWNDQSRQLTLNATKEQLETASATPTGGWTRFSGQEWTKNVNGYYDQPFPPAFTRYERQEVVPAPLPGAIQNRETVRAPSERKGATDLQPAPSEPENGTMSTATRASDELISTRVHNAIRRDPNIQSHNIQATVSDGVVTLDGEVPNSLQRQALESDVSAVPGVQRVINRVATPGQ